MPLSNHVILIIAPGVSLFVVQLQDAIEAERGECVVARDVATALARCRRFNFTAALVNMQHRDIVGQLTMPAILYEPMEGHLSIIARLKALLSSTRANQCHRRGLTRPAFLTCANKSWLDLD